MATEKVSLTLSQKAVKEARRRAGTRGLSAYVDEALRLKLHHDHVRAWLEEAERKHGPIPDDIRKQVEAEWPDPSRRKRNRKA